MSQEEHLPDTLTPQTPVSLNNADILPPTWGRLVKRRVFLNSIDLRKQSYTFGRKETCDIYIDARKMHTNLLKVTSKEHFIISRDYTLVPYIKDLSKNGTFINGVLIGKGNTTALCDGDLISVGHKLHEVYQYKDESTASVSEEFDKKYKITRSLGRGAFGEVYLALARRTCDRYAVKRILISYKDELKIENEINILNKLNHQCVIKMIEAIYTPQGYVYIVLDFMEGGDLQKRVLKHKTLSEFVAKLYVYQIVLAVRYLHSCGIAHRDLKPENVLLETKSQNTLIKVTDFGLSKIVHENSLMNTLCGTPLYVAPEILHSDGKTSSYSYLVDVWSLGCIIYFILFGRTPFQRNDDEYEDNEDCIPDLFERIKQGKFVIPKEDCCEETEPVTEEAINLIYQMLVLDPKKRITVENLIKHGWFQDQKMLTTVTKLL